MQITQPVAGMTALNAVVLGCATLWPGSMDTARRDEMFAAIAKALGPKRDPHEDGTNILLMQMMLAAAVRFSHRRLPDRLQVHTPFQRRKVAPRFDHWWDDLAGFLGADEFVTIVAVTAPVARWSCITEMNTNRAVLVETGRAIEVRFHDLGYSNAGKPVEVDWRQCFVLERSYF